MRQNKKVLKRHFSILFSFSSFVSRFLWNFLQAEKVIVRIKGLIFVPVPEILKENISMDKNHRKSTLLLGGKNNFLHINKGNWDK